jgi:hypothetical protein
LSTVKESIANLRRIGSALAPAIATAFRPNSYTNFAREGARAALMQCDFLSDEEKEVEVPMLVSSITVDSGPIKDSLVFKMNGRSIYAADRSAVSLIMHPPAPEIVRQWVEEEKRLTAIDYNEDGSRQDTETIARRVMAAMQRNPADFFGVHEPGKKSLDPTGLPQFAHMTQLTPDRLEQALVLVLNGWRDQLLNDLPGAVAWRIRTVLHS